LKAPCKYNSAHSHPRKPQPKKQEVNKTLRAFYLADKITGELVTYSQAKEIFYSKPRGTLENVFDEYIETNITSAETITAPNFIESIRI